MSPYITLSIAVMLPVIAALIFSELEKRTSFGEKKTISKQILIGTVFGGLAILGTEWGIPINGAQINCRDAAVLIAGLFFGAPAGIIAGTIGALERWFAVLWGVGTFTRVACSVSTFVAGFYAAFLRKYMFEDKKPGWGMAFTVGVVMETFHLTMVFVTNLGCPDEAFDVITACTLPMIGANATAVAIGAVVVSLSAKESIGFDKKLASISQSVQKKLLLVVIVTFFVSSTFIASLQYGIVASESENTLNNVISEVERGIEDGIDEEELCNNLFVGNDGEVMVVENGKPTGFSSRSDKKVRDGLASKVGKYKEGEVFKTYSDGDIFFCIYKEHKGKYIFAYMPDGEVLRSRDIAVYANSYMEILIFALLFTFIFFIIKKVVVDKIKEVNRSLAIITSGNLNEIVRVKSNQEFKDLSEDINETVGTLKRYIKEAEVRIAKELEVAREIQVSSLPTVTPELKRRKDIDLFASMNTAKEVGGDFYDFYFAQEDMLYFGIADVSGKGIPAAMFMMRAKTELRKLSEANIPPNEILKMANNNLCKGNEAGMFVTVWLGVLDLKTGILKYSNAGHNPPLLKRASGNFEYVKCLPGFVLAGIEDVNYKEQEIALNPGDIIYLYTDGLTEGNNEEKELYGEERLLSAINLREYEDMEELCKTVKEDLDKFVDNAPQFDDITMMALRYNGAEPEIRLDFEEAKIEDINAITEFIEEHLEKMGCSRRTIIQMDVAVDEIYSNIVKYAYGDGTGPASIIIKELDNPHRASIRFIDEGKPYNPLTKEAPDITLNADERQIGGLGIFITRQTMDSMKYYYENDKNVLTIKKRI